MTKGTVLVASPSAIGSRPEARGSSVPAWPAFLALKARFTTLTAWVEVMPTGLSSTTQPCTSRFFGRGCCACGGATVSLFVVMMVVLVDLQGLAQRVAAHRIGIEQRIDAFGLREALILAEADIGRVFQV